MHHQQLCPFHGVLEYGLRKGSTPHHSSSPSDCTLPLSGTSDMHAILCQDMLRFPDTSRRDQIIFQRKAEEEGLPHEPKTQVTATQEATLLDSPAKGYISSLEKFPSFCRGLTCSWGHTPLTAKPTRISEPHNPSLSRTATVHPEEEHALFRT